MFPRPVTAGASPLRAEISALVRLAVPLAVALGLSIAGLARSRRRALAALGLVLTLFFGWIFVWYCYVFSSELPGAELALDVGAAVPAVSLLDQRGQAVELEPLARGKLVLVFFRGHW